MSRSREYSMTIEEIETAMLASVKPPKKATSPTVDPKPKRHKQQKRSRKLVTLANQNSSVEITPSSLPQSDINQFQTSIAPSTSAGRPTTSDDPQISAESALSTASIKVKKENMDSPEPTLTFPVTEPKEKESKHKYQGGEESARKKSQKDKLEGKEQKKPREDEISNHLPELIPLKAHQLRETIQEEQTQLHYARARKALHTLVQAFDSIDHIVRKKGSEESLTEHTDGKQAASPPEKALSNELRLVEIRSEKPPARPRGRKRKVDQLKPAAEVGNLPLENVSARKSQNPPSSKLAKQPSTWTRFVKGNELSKNDYNIVAQLCKTMHRLSKPPTLEVCKAMTECLRSGASHPCNAPEYVDWRNMYGRVPLPGNDRATNEALQQKGGQRASEDNSPKDHCAEAPEQKKQKEQQEQKEEKSDKGENQPYGGHRDIDARLAESRRLVIEANDKMVQAFIDLGKQMRKMRKV